jgi:hypothetical protein
MFANTNLMSGLGYGYGRDLYVHNEEYRDSVQSGFNEQISKVIALIFPITESYRVLVFNRGDAFSPGPLSTEIGLNERYSDVVLKAVKESALIITNECSVFKADNSFVAYDPTGSDEKVNIIPFFTLLPPWFHPDFDINITGRENGYELLSIEAAERFLDEKSVYGSQKAFELITG